MQAHDVDYEIIGDDLQLVEVELDPGESVVVEAGAMTYMEDGIVFESKLGDGTEPRGGFFDKLFGAGKRMLAGGSLFLTQFRNAGGGKRRVASAALLGGLGGLIDGD